MSLLLFANAVIGRSRMAAPAPAVRASRTLERTFSGHPAWGGGNVNNNAVGNRRIDFVHEGTNWECWQIIPFDGPAISGVLGACRLHLRNRDKGRGANTLEEMPARLILSKGAGDTADWTDLPWSFTRTTSSAQFTNVASGGSARKAVTYFPDRATAGLTAAGVGIAQGESFTIELFF